MESELLSVDPTPRSAQVNWPRLITSSLVRLSLLSPSSCVTWSEAKPSAFTTEASINLADDEELLKLMRRAGFYGVFVVIETPVEESLKDAQKSQNTRRDLIDSIR